MTIQEMNNLNLEKPLIKIIDFVTLCCGILTIETLDCFFLPQQVEKSSSGGFETKFLLYWAKWSVQHNGTKSIILMRGFSQKTTSTATPNLLKRILAILVLEVITAQPHRRQILPICGLGASVGCERKSEHSTRRDESHKQGVFVFYEASALSEHKYSYSSTS